MLALGAMALGVPLGLPAQEREDRTLLTQAQMTAVINEVSGERAMHHVLELVPYQRVRPPEEYSGPYRESKVMAAFAKEYGFTNVAIEVFQQGGTAWQPVQGELWMTSPKSVKLFDIHDIALSLASLNANGDFSGDLVDVGPGRAPDFEGKDVSGKFVLSSGATNAVYAQAMQHGARGVLGVSAIGFQRAVDYPNQIVSSTVNAQPGTVAWSVTPEVQHNLAAQLARGDKITIRSIVKSVEVPAKAEYVHAEIPGDGSTTQEVAISGHLYEGVIKQGANDDNSGCALTLEIGRAYLKLIAEGKLPRPKRTINFQWVPEISGTNAYLNAHPDKAKNIIGTLNFDMEALRVGDSRSYWVLQRTPDTFPSYLNDIAQSMMEYIADISRERVRFRRSGYAPSEPVESPRGSKDAFYIKIDKHYGSSDHVTYMQHGIPAVMFITWPDMWYHSSEDTPDKQDPTQYKRAAAVGLGALAVISTGTDEMAARVLNENLGRGLARMGESHTKGLGYMADATSGPALTDAYKEARIAIQHQADIEKGVIRSASVLWTSVADGQKRTAAFVPLIDQRAASLLNEVKTAYQLQAVQRNVAAAEPVQSPDERAAASLLVESLAGAGAAGGRGGGGGGGGRGAGGGAAGGGGGGRGRGAAGPTLPEEYNAEFSILLGKGMTALQIRDFLSGEFTPLPLADVMTVLRARESQGLIKLTPKAGR
ncbi:MAG TPA: M28 family peptidase [Gemmatimonadaceae bacterium]|nr:M28 family peptidase [Gemmatimonadaceae bacterium]